MLQCERISWVYDFYQRQPPDRERMENTTRTAVARELQDCIAQHVERLFELQIVAGSFTLSVPPNVLASVESLSLLCAAPPTDPLLAEKYEEVCACIDEIKHFFQIIHYNEHNLSENRQAARILAQAQDWCQAAAARMAQAGLDGVWELIDPVKPDSLSQISAEVFEALWWQPVPWMDIEILRRTEGVIIQDEIVSPERLPGGAAVRFAVTPAARQVLDKGA